MITILPTPLTCDRCVKIQIKGASHTWKAIIPYNLDRVPIMLVSAFLDFCVRLYQIWLFFSVLCVCVCVLFQCKPKKWTCEYQNICNCNNFLRGGVHFLTDLQGCQYFWPWLYDNNSKTFVYSILESTASTYNRRMATWGAEHDWNGKTVSIHNWLD